MVDIMRMAQIRYGHNWKPAMIWHVAIYIRLSREDGNDESLSVINQRTLLCAYLEQEFVGAQKLVDCYVDDGASGTDVQRPEFQRMLQDIELGSVNCILCKTLSRAFRNYSDQGYFLETFFPLHNTRFVTLGDPKIDSYLNPELIQGLEIPINGLLNDRYAAKTSQDVRRTLDSKRASGAFIGAFAPYGYQKNDGNKNQLCVDTEAAKVVRTIFEWYVHENMSKAGIAKRLNERGILNPTAYKHSIGLRFSGPVGAGNDGLWGPKTIRDILLNPVYIGTMVQGKQRVISYKLHDRISTPQDEWYIVAGNHAPIVEETIFYAAQTLHQQGAHAQSNSREVSLFSGFVRCGDCGKAMTRRTAKGHVYYACRTYLEKDRARCTRHSIRLEDLEQVTISILKTQIEIGVEPIALLQAIQQSSSTGKQVQSIAQQMKQWEKKIEKRQTALDTLYIDWKLGDLPLIDYQRMSTKLTVQMAQLNQTVVQLQAEFTQTTKTALEAETTAHHFLLHPSLSNLNRGILAAFLDKILVYEQDVVEVQLRYGEP